MNGLNHFAGSGNYKVRSNHTATQGPLSVLSEDEQFFKETGLIEFVFTIIIIG